MTWTTVLWDLAVLNSVVVNVCQPSYELLSGSVIMFAQKLTMFFNTYPSPMHARTIPSLLCRFIIHISSSRSCVRCSESCIGNCVCVRLCVHALKGKRLELLTPKLIHYTVSSASASRIGHYGAIQMLYYYYYKAQKNFLGAKFSKIINDTVEWMPRRSRSWEANTDITCRMSTSTLADFSVAFADVTFTLYTISPPQRGLRNAFVDDALP